MKKDYSIIHKITTFLMLTALMIPALKLGANAQSMAKPATDAKAKPLTEDRKIMHVLNRLGFGARSGDVERVKQIGIQKYIEQQLNPVSLNDSATEAKLEKFDVLKMSNDELFAKYPNGGAVLMAVAQNNGLKRQDLQGIRQNNQNKQNADQMKNDAVEKKQDNLSEADRQKYQQEVAALYKEYNLGRPQQITQQLNASRILRAVYSEKQLQEAMVDFWTNHFNVYAGKAATRWFLPEYDRDVIRPNALGNFKDLLTATAKSPAMLFYLDNFQSMSPTAPTAGNNRRPNANNQTNNPQRREQLKRQYNLTDAELDARLKQNQGNQKRRNERGINENYAREIMELHTLGVEGGYSQKDIQELARAFTGWTIVDARGYRRAFAGIANGTEDQRLTRQMRLAGIPETAKSGTFFFNERTHDQGEKTILGQKINQGGIKDGEKAIEILVNQPATAKFIARKLAVKFVSDNPSEALVERVAKAFQDSKGDIKTTLRAIFNDKEFFAPENYRAKIKTPFEVVVSAIRTVGAETNGNQIQAMLQKMGEPLYGYQAPTGYPDTAEDWVNTGALLERLNFAVALASNRIPGTKVNLKPFEGKDDAEILNRSIDIILDGQISPNTKATLLKQLEQPLPAEPKLEIKDETGDAMENTAMMPNQGGGKNRQNRQAKLLPPSGDAEVFKVVGLMLGTPEFQRQ
ncbi:MAG: DUF1800 domain-containing protein [Pyrinomonadaceae bacterium]|nr:DUF1800 domain-containing protein [Pyrinomonadaceae bacterium]